MSVDHRRSYIFMAHELLNRPDVIRGCDQLGREGMSQTVTRGLLENSRANHGTCEGSLDRGFVKMVSLSRTFPGSDGSARREKPLPGPIERGGGCLLVDVVRQEGSAQSHAEISCVLFSKCRQLASERVDGEHGQKGVAVFLPLSLAHDDFSRVEIQVADPELKAFEQT